MRLKQMLSKSQCLLRSQSSFELRQHIYFRISFFCCCCCSAVLFVLILTSCSHDTRGHSHSTTEHLAVTHRERGLGWFLAEAAADMLFATAFQLAVSICTRARLRSQMRVRFNEFSSYAYACGSEWVCVRLSKFIRKRYSLTDFI